ncbi:MAG: efflux RND transporter periplasmic adaptor subunit [Leptolyngbyaceae cyanobacterium MO_188.B28]|nr:efflux RND transporter periplasmic adaptor subunit [Leptolyngbyaceae cyanobacterium MO_188.B28]
MDSESSELFLQNEKEVALQRQQPISNTGAATSISHHSIDLGSTTQHPAIESSPTNEMASNVQGSPSLPSSETKAALPNAQLHRTKRRPWLWLFALLLVPALAVKVRGVSSPSPAQTSQVLALPVETLTLKSVSAYEVSRAYTGEIAARRSSNLGFERSGAVVEILVDEGDRVQVGDPLARLDVRSLDARRRQLVAQKDQAIARLQELEVGPRPEDIAAAQAAVADWEQQAALGRIQRQRREDLYQRGAISREELDQQTFGTGSLESRLNQAQSQLDELLAGTRSEQISAQTAQVRQLEAGIQSIDVDLAKSILTAPFDGRVSSRLIDEGVVVDGGQSVLRLVEDSVLEARIGVPVDTAADLTVGSRQLVHLGPDAYSARVAALLPELDVTSRTVTVILEISPDTPLTVGQTVRLVLSETEPTDGYWLPSTALVPGERGLWSVYLLAEPSPSESTSTEKSVFQVGRRDVEVLHTEADRVLVRGLITSGEKAIINGVHRLAPGQLVQVAD